MKQEFICTLSSSKLEPKEDLVRCYQCYKWKEGFCFVFYCDMPPRGFCHEGKYR